MMEEEERRRQVMGMSSLGKCLALAQLVDHLKAEGKKHDAAGVVDAFKASGQRLDSWNPMTTDRYISVGRRIAGIDANLLSLLETWEFHLGRKAAFDSITALRTFVSLSLTAPDYMFVASA